MLTAVPEYAGTNESLDAIVLGLGVGPGDTVLAVAGSGDQAFAMLAAGARVTAVDSRSAQIKYVLHRVNCLRKGDVPGFLGQSLGTSTGTISGPYFQAHGRIELVRQNLANLKVLPNIDIADAARGEVFTKIYTSNIYDYTERYSMRRSLEILAASLAPGGLLYTAIEAMASRQLGEDYMASMGLQFDAPSTAIARQHEELMWNPVVYRKMPSPAVSP